MTVTLNLTTDQEHRLTQAATQRGLDTDRLLHEMLNAVLAQLEPAPSTVPLRVPGLHAGQIWISDDFDAPLPDSFWIGTP